LANCSTSFGEHSTAWIAVNQWEAATAMTAATYAGFVPASEMQTAAIVNSGGLTQGGDND